MKIISDNEIFIMPTSWDKKDRGGEFFNVQIRSHRMTLWAKSADELRSWLVKQEQPFSNLIPLS
jgi:hypothetical protein